MVLFPIALALQFDNCRVMDESVYGCDRHHAVREDMIPCAEGLVGSDDKAATLIAVGDELKQDMGFGIRFFHVANVVNNDDAVFIQPGHRCHQVEVPLGLL